MPRILAIDYGDRRMGLALSDPTRTIAQPLEILASRHAQAAIEPLAALIAKYDVDTVVVGLPLLPSGDEGEMAERVRRWCDKLQAACPDVAIDLVDERLTSQWAGRVAREQRGRRGKRSHDELAAQMILESYLLTKANRA